MAQDVGQARAAEAPQGGAPPAAAYSNATRYLCAASYLDDGFAETVVEQIIRGEHHAVAPAHGIHLGPILRHALAARRRRLVRDGLVTAVLVMGFVAGVAVTSVWLVQAVALVVSLWLLFGAFVRLVTGRFLAAFGFFVTAVVVIPVAASVLTLLAFKFQGYGVGLGDLQPEYGVPGLPSGGPPWLLVLVTLLAVWGICAGHRLAVHHTLAVELTPQMYDPAQAPPPGAGLARRIAELEYAQEGNVSIYSPGGDVSPFIGFGKIQEEWNLVTPLRPATSFDVVPDDLAEADEDADNAASPMTFVPIDIDEFHDRVRAGVESLAAPGMEMEEAISQLVVEDRVFVAGLLPRGSRYLEGDRPRQHVDADEVRRVARAERGRVRHYLCVRMLAWQSELEVTAFVHLSTRGGMLYVEFVATVQPGISADYRRVDTYERLDLRNAMRALGGAVGDVFLSPLAVSRVVGTGWRALWDLVRTPGDVKQIRRQLMFDYGCRHSVRERGAAPQHAVRFQLYDALERIAVVQRRTLGVVVRTLREHGYDVSDISGQATTVINNSRFTTNVSNSTLVNSPVATGNRARALFKTIAGGE